MGRSVTVKELLNVIEKEGYAYSYEGNETILISSICSLDKPKEHSLMWVKDLSHAMKMEDQKYAESVIISPVELHVDLSTCGVIRCDTPKMCFFSLVKTFWGKGMMPGIGETSVVKSNRVGKNAVIGEHCYISSEAEIGDNVIIGNGVNILNHVVIGNECIIHSGVTIGDDGMGMGIDTQGIPHKAMQSGSTILRDRVEVFSGAVIMRGAIDDTVIESDSKIGALSCIGHNVYIGACCLIMSGVTICGSVTVGAHSYVGAGAVIRNQICIGEKSFVCMGGVVTKDVEENAVATSSISRIKAGGSADIMRSMQGMPI